ncbi:MAG: sugar transferase [Cyanobacteria bacterium P01_H01_bin.74]
MTPVTSTFDEADTDLIKTASVLDTTQPLETEPIQWADSVEKLFSFKAQSTGFKAQQALKRLIDIVCASLGLIALMPLLLMVAAAVKLTSEGPIFYKSKRIGKNFEPFYMMKFRTMEVNADAKRAELRKKANLDNTLFKLENDPRITKIGRFLRAFSLDEFPQLLNVIKGEMSLVGPRPLMPDESEYFERPYTMRFNVYPGITGQWQVSGRSNLNFNQLCQLEMNYVLQWSLFNDFRILLMTFPAVLASKGAY